VTGKLAIFRGAVKQDGTLVKMTEQLWRNYDLDDSGFCHGDLCCTMGSCTVTLSTDRMNQGEIFYLSFFKESFYTMDTFSSTRYWLFNDAALLPDQTTVYDHLFVCRSFEVYNNTQSVQGKTFAI
jgi:hypothetical protein